MGLVATEAYVHNSLIKYVEHLFKALAIVLIILQHSGGPQPRRAHISGGKETHSSNERTAACNECKTHAPADSNQTLTQAQTQSTDLFVDASPLPPRPSLEMEVPLHAARQRSVPLSGGATNGFFGRQCRISRQLEKESPKTKLPQSSYGRPNIDGIAPTPVRTASLMQTTFAVGWRVSKQLCRHSITAAIYRGGGSEGRARREEARRARMGF